VREGIVWTYRLAVDRDPTEAEIAHRLTEDLTPQALCRQLLASRDFDAYLYDSAAPATLDPEAAFQAVIWGFRLFLSRDHGNEASARAMVSGLAPLDDLRWTLAMSEEFRVRNDQSLEALLTGVVVRKFRPLCTAPAAPGSFHDFLGNATRCSFLPPGYSVISGTVQGVPGSRHSPPMHDASEWIGTLRAALEAKDVFTVVELGAGWAPWLVSGHKAAQVLGISDTRLVGVEGSAGHVAFMRQNFIDNGINPDAHRLICGVAGVSDGVAYFPDLAKPDEDYGSAADFSVGGARRGMIEVRSYSMETLLRELPPIVDIVHCDIQGAEADFMAASIDTLNSRVRRIVIGTHGRFIEGRLLDLFSDHGWGLEHETVCSYCQEASGHLALSHDGAQVWRNPRV
jgi:FkbM family methyltransferase